MEIRVLSMFPDYFSSPLGVSLVAKAREQGLVSIEIIDLRRYGVGRHRTLDDAPFGGGAGMVMMVEPLANALAPLAATHRVLLSPGGIRLDQATLGRLAGLSAITLVCGRYEGVDERVSDHFIDEEISVGDYVIAGGEAAALILVEGIVRLLPGVVGNPDSVVGESFQDGLLEEPHYTRPAVFRGWEVPPVLLSGDHAAVERWRQSQRQARTRARRPDLWGSAGKPPTT